MVDGQRTAHVRNARFEAKRAAALLQAAAERPVPVTPLVVLVGTRNLTVTAHPGDVEILGADQLVRWLNDQPPRMLPSDLAELQRFADRPATWHTGVVPAEDGAAMLAWYRGLEAAIGYSRPVVHSRPVGRRPVATSRRRATSQSRGDGRRRTPARSSGAARRRRQSGGLGPALAFAVLALMYAMAQGLAGGLTP